jgi:LysM repeat protein
MTMRKLVLFLVFLLMMVSVASAQTAGEETYTVRLGDNIAGIANAYDVSVDAILIRNNIIDPNRILAGQTLIIPTGAVTVPQTHVVDFGERLIDIATRYNTTVEALIATNNLTQPDSLIVGQVLTLPPTGGPATFPRTYFVEIGDTLRNIGADFGVTWQQLAAFNNIASPNFIQAGIVIQIPPADYVPPAQAPVGVPVVVQAQPLTYIVQQGDVLEGIANAFSVTIDSLRQFNNLAVSDAIFIGQVLTIPPTGGPVVAQTVIPARSTINGWYTVRAGDTLFAIAADFGLNVYALAQTNGILNLNSIFAGQALQVHGH